MTKPGRNTPKDDGAAPGEGRGSGTPARPAQKSAKKPAKESAKEIGGRGGLDPTRYGDWEKDGRAVDF